MNELYDFINDTENYYSNLKLALKYEEMGQLSSAISFFLRAAERTEFPTEQYLALLKAGYCFHSYDTHTSTVKRLYQTAIQVCPIRPEAYYLLSRLYEQSNNWFDCYLTSGTGLKICDFSVECLPFRVGRSEKYAMMYQYFLGLWFTDHTNKAKEVLLDLLNNYEMDELYIRMVNSNLQRISQKFS